MRIDNRRQAEALLLALAIGAAAGLLYDLLRPPRWQGKGLRAFLLDALFCLALGIALFFFAMSAGDGRLGVVTLGAAWAGFLAYQTILSPALLPRIVKVYQFFAGKLDFLKKTAKKFAVFVKKVFQNLIACFIVRR